MGLTLFVPSCSIFNNNNNNLYISISGTGCTSVQYLLLASPYAALATPLFCTSCIPILVQSVPKNPVSPPFYFGTMLTQPLCFLAHPLSILYFLYPTTMFLWPPPPPPPISVLPVPIYPVPPPTSILVQSVPTVTPSSPSILVQCVPNHPVSPPPSSIFRVVYYLICQA